ncbi:dephospho-CoA kinase [soil metagenome]
MGLTGGIASGKSVVAARLAELGAVVVDADRVAREVVEPGTPGLAAVVEAFGSGVLGPDGSLDRPALGAIVFADPAKLKILNGITHPAVLQRSHELFAEAEAADPNAIVIYDVPLLAEGARAEEFDVIAVVEAELEVRVHRMVELRGMSETDARNRIAAQASNETRRALADVIIDSNGTLAETLRQTDEVWHTLRQRVSEAAPTLE